MKPNIPRLPDMEQNPRHQPSQPAPVRKVVRKKRRKKKTATRSSSQPVARGGQARDRLGRFASKACAVIWGAAKGTARTIAKTVKTAKKAHRTIKRVGAASRRRQRLEERERVVALRKRERRLGTRKVRRRKRR